MEDHPRDSRGNVTYHAYTCPAYKAPGVRDLPWYKPKGKCNCLFRWYKVYEDDDCIVWHSKGQVDNYGFSIEPKPGWREFQRAAIDARYRGLLELKDDLERLIK